MPGRLRLLWRPKRRICLRALAIAAALGLTLALALACATTVRPPPHPADPVAVFLLDLGRTSALVLPAPDGRMVKWVYGDWNYYALAHTGFFSAVAALCWPTPSALGRRAYPALATPDAARQWFGSYAEAIGVILVARRDARQLEADLEKIFQQNAPTRIFNKPYDLEFTRHPEPYTAFHNSNRMIARWLRELGCQVRGPALLAHWKVEPPPKSTGSFQ